MGGYSFLQINVDKSEVHTEQTTHKILSPLCAVRLTSQNVTVWQDMKNVSVSFYIVTEKQKSYRFTLTYNRLYKPVLLTTVSQKMLLLCSVEKLLHNQRSTEVCCPNTYTTEHKMLLAHRGTAVSFKGILLAGGELWQRFCRSSPLSVNLINDDRSTRACQSLIAPVQTIHTLISQYDMNRADQVINLS